MESNDILLLVTSAFFIFLAGLFNAVMDSVADETAFNRSIFSRWNKKYWSKVHSWRNKYEVFPDGSTNHKPRFWGSTTFLVFLTDGWHLFQFLWSTSFIIALLVNPLYYSGIGFLFGLLTYKFVYTSGFWLGYNKLFRK